MKANLLSLAEIVAQDQTRIAETLGLDTREARLETQILLTQALGVNRAYLIAHQSESPSPDDFAKYTALRERRLAGEPIAYIFGEREFFGLSFQVSPAVLIPRPETELLVETALEHMLVDTRMCVLDLGTGSGAVAIALAKQRPDVFVIGLDQSAEALRIAQSNAHKLHANNVVFVRSNWFSGLGVRKFDMIVGNPPYIPDQDPHLMQGDLRFEPRSALAAGADGLDCIRQIAGEAVHHLNAGGWLMLEHGYDQASQVAMLFRQAGFSEIRSLRDLSGIERVTMGRLS